MSWLKFFSRKFRPKKPEAYIPPPSQTPRPFKVRRHFFNLKNVQCYGTFFPFWAGWISAGHVLTSSQHKWPGFTGNGAVDLWPDGLDAALKGCRLPDSPPPAPYGGQLIRVMGFPAGSRHLETRMGKVYMERNTGSGHWIAHIKAPDEPVVTGMSGGPVIDIKTDLPIGILITRNSPADLDRDEVPDQSCDFIALSSVWHAIQKAQSVV